MAYYYVQFLFLLLSWFRVSESYSARNNITATQFLRDPDTLESSNAIFKFGFFSPINSTYRYVGIWYNKEVADNLEVVWVANRENPLNDTSGVIKISDDGNLQLFNGQNKRIWSSNITDKNEINGSVAQLRDTGNLVLLAKSREDIIWQSFDHISHSLLHHIKLNFVENTTTKPRIISWKSASDPSPGRFSAGLNHLRLPEFFVWDGNRPYWRSGPWVQNMFLGVRAGYHFAYKNKLHIENNSDGSVSLFFNKNSGSVLEHYVLNYNGQLLLRTDYSQQDGGKWKSSWNSQESECDIYGKCGEFGSCNSSSSPKCSCLHGFEPKNDQEWSAGNWSGGCVRKTTLHCRNIGGEEDGFWRLRNVKVPDKAVQIYSEGKVDCRRKCKESCSCLSYAYYLGWCMTWNESLIDIQEFADETAGIDLFIRLAYSELGHKRKWYKVITAMVVVGTAALVVIFLYSLWRLYHWRYGNTIRNMKANPLCNKMDGGGVSHEEFQDLPLFQFEDLVVAIDNFSDTNKIGQGGFGPVYKGKFKDGQEIAVKRLSRASVQGLTEFMNEVVLISKLQHRNLVRLLGCCVDGEEKLLVYEYMPNKSLDAFLFNPSDQEHLDWKKRFTIIKGITRGLLYLHRDSRLRIIHRDLKASNILLDGSLNPKISDFGTARIFGGNQDQDDTKRIVGTYGYMAPEYAMEGRFSEKSDVYSLGVLLLEIVSGRRNTGFKDDESLSLLGHAWKLWNDSSILSLIDPAISESIIYEEILKCVQLGLLCVQELPEDRPSISMIVSMIESEVTNLPCPSQPGFTQRRVAFQYNAQQYSNENYSANPVSITALSGR